MIDSESRVPAVAGQFRLDLDDNEATDSYPMPQLIEPDLHEILDEPVKLPVTRFVSLYSINHCSLSNRMHSFSWRNDI